MKGSTDRVKKTGFNTLFRSRRIERGIKLALVAIGTMDEIMVGISRDLSPPRLPRVTPSISSTPRKTPPILFRKLGVVQKKR